MLFISLDDLAAYGLGYYGNPIICTPNLDRLAAEGVRFETAYTNCPVCTRPGSPSSLAGTHTLAA